MESRNQDQTIAEVADDMALPRLVGIFLGIGLFCLPFFVPPPEGMPVEAWRVTAVLLLMACWWMTEAIPIAATALVPLVLFPLVGVAPIAQVAAPYANPLVYMMLGGFMIGLAIQRSHLHVRIALFVLSLAGRRPDRLVGGFMLATAFLSMWMSNTATAAMMLPIGVSVVSLLAQDENLQKRGLHARNLPVALMLGIAFSAGIGGMGTLIGTPPNAVMAGFLSEKAGISLGFAQWMMIGVPTAAILLVLTWIVLTKWIFSVGTEELVGVRRMIAQERESLGRMSQAEIRVSIILVCAALAWTFRPLIENVFPDSDFSDAGIAMIAALALFLTPEAHITRRKLLDWQTTRDLPWNVMVLIGGGLSLGAMVQGSGLATWVGESLSVTQSFPIALVVVLAVGATMVVGHVTSNTATAATIVPLAVSLALTTGASPLMLAIPVAMACSCSLMMPVATPPNAIVYASGLVTVGQMAKAGGVVGLMALGVITLMTMIFVPLIFGG